jgi:hypothetical protein
MLLYNLHATFPLLSIPIAAFFGSPGHGAAISFRGKDRMNSPSSTPAADSTYVIAAFVPKMAPAIISVWTFVLFSLSLKNFAIGASVICWRGPLYENSPAAARKIFPAGPEEKSGKQVGNRL